MLTIACCEMELVSAAWVEESVAEQRLKKLWGAPLRVVANR